MYIYPCQYTFVVGVYFDEGKTTGFLKIRTGILPVATASTAAQTFFNLLPCPFFHQLLFLGKGFIGRIELTAL